MCAPEDEPLILQQFLRFSVTRPLTQQLILQELCQKNEDTRARLQEHMLKLMSNNNTKQQAAADTKEPRRQQTSPGSQQQPASPGSVSSAASAVSPARSGLPSPSPASSLSRTSPESVLSHAPPPPPPQQAVPTSSQPPHNGSLASPATSSSASSLSSPSPLNKLQSMHPFDYRKAERGTPESAARSPAEKAIPPSINPMRFPPGPPGYPLPPSFGVQYPGLTPYQVQLYCEYSLQILIYFKKIVEI